MSLSHLPSPVPMTGSGTTQGLLSKYLLNSLPNRMGNFPTLALGWSLVETEPCGPSWY